MSIKLLSAQQLSDSKTLNQLIAMAKRMELTEQLAELGPKPIKLGVATLIVAKQKEVIAQSDADRLAAHTAINEQAQLELSTEQSTEKKTMPKSTAKVIADNQATVKGDNQALPENLATERKAKADAARAKKKIAVVDGLTAIANGQPLSEASVEVFAEVQATVAETIVETTVEPIAEKKVSDTETFELLQARAATLGYSLYRAKSGKLNLEPVDHDGNPIGKAVFTENGGVFLDAIVEWIETSEIAARTQAEIDAEESSITSAEHRLERQIAANRNLNRKQLTAKNFKQQAIDYADEIGVFQEVDDEEATALTEDNADKICDQLIQMVLERQAYLKATDTKNKAAQRTEKLATVVVTTPADVAEKITAAPEATVVPSHLADYQERLVMLLDSAGTDEAKWLLDNMADWKASITPQKKAAGSKPSNGGKVKDSTPTGAIKPVKRGTKIATVIELLHKGTTIAELQEKVNPNEASIKVYLNWDIKTKGYGCRKDDAGNLYLTMPEGMTEPLITAA